MNDTTDQVASAEQVKPFKVLLRDKPSIASKHIRDYLYVKATDARKNITLEDFDIKTSNDFDPEILHEYTGALLHNMRQEDLERLIAFLEKHPEMKNSVIVESTGIATDEQMRLYNVLREMGVMVEERPIMDFGPVSKRLLGINQ